MKAKFVIRDLFKLSGGVTVFACEGENDTSASIGGAATILAGEAVRQSIFLIGEREMLNQSIPKTLKAIETRDKVDMSVEEAQSGLWSLLIDGAKQNL